jgi:CBS domain-containing protein
MPGPASRANQHADSTEAEGWRFNLNAADVMTRHPITAGPTMSSQEVAQLLVRHSISAVPVVDASGTLLGIVSEGDLVRRADIGRDERASWWLQMLAEGEDVAPEFLAYVRSGHRLARDLMTREVVTVEEQAPLAEVARLLEAHRIKRVPVLRQGRVVGIVSRADLVRAWSHQEETAERPPQPATPFDISRPAPPSIDEF